MPSVIKPDMDGWTPDLESAVSVLGNRAKLAILRYVRENDEARFGEILTATGIKEGTLINHLNNLLQVGVLTSDIPAGVRGHRRYSVAPERISVLIDTWESFALGRDHPHARSQEHSS